MQIEEKILENATEEKKKEWETYKEEHKDIAFGGFALEYNIVNFYSKTSKTISIL